ncbi:MAG TPA: SRPBCC domain-containing protein [Candidatus Dormibacteraeota bacterium]|jgi:uncharacterized protein YndB with AHSA1/START domain
MTTTNPTMVTTQVYRVHIKAAPQAVWDAITKPEWSERYGYRTRTELDLRRGGVYKAYTTKEMREVGKIRGFDVPDIGVDGEVIESDPPRKLVQTFRMLMDPEVSSEGFTRLTYEIKEIQPGVSKLTIIHDLEGAPKLALLVGGELDAEGAGGGWAWVLSDLKSLLETGSGLAD